MTLHLMSPIGDVAGVADSALNIVERELKPGEVTLDDLERAFNEAPDQMTSLQR